MKHIIRFSLVLLALAACHKTQSQDYHWQQRVEYTMNVSLDVRTHHVTGTQRLVYFNNSPDTLTKVYYHLYFNAFQPGSMMDVRSRSISDPDRRVADRISKLSESETGYQNVLSLLQDGKPLTYQVEGTVMEVTLAKPILPKTKSVFDMKFESQVPIQIRRSGRDSKEGIAYSMTQWYPKMAEYDYQGWHAYQYVAREFQGVWGDFDVSITLDQAYMIAGTGKLQNPDKIGFGYEKPGTKVNRPAGNLTWHFKAKDVIDFAWAADPDYTHDTMQVPGGPELHFFYQKNEKTEDSWKQMEPYAVRLFEYLNVHFGKYPFDTYSVIQGGDGGMEYPMCTLILGEGTFKPLVGLVSHEVAHSWFQSTLASNEALYAWMDEGFADFARNEAMASMFNEEGPHNRTYSSYFDYVKSPKREPASQHSDHFNTNLAYSRSAYTLGNVFLQQMKYLIGDKDFYAGMLRYYNTWKMKHPEPNDFIRVMEKQSGLQLHWYLRYFISTTRSVDYAIDSVMEQDGGVRVDLARIGDFPMPIDLVVTYTDGSKELFYIPMNELMGSKPVEDNGLKRTNAISWPWVNKSYTVQISKPLAAIASMDIDPSQRMADVDRINNRWEPVKK